MVPPLVKDLEQVFPEGDYLTKVHTERRGSFDALLKM
jgi:hypothetical protein